MKFLSKNKLLNGASQTRAGAKSGAASSPILQQTHTAKDSEGGFMQTHYLNDTRGLAVVEAVF